MKRSLFDAGLVFAFALMLTACDGITTPQDGGNVSLSTAVPGGEPTTDAALRPSFDVRQTVGSDELVITRVAMVLREIEVERLNEDCPEDATGVEDDICEEFAIGPLLVELPLDGSVERVLSVQVPPDTYDEIEFEIHKPDDEDPAGQAFIEEHPSFADVSIRVEGTFNGEEFVFLQDLNEDQEIELVDPLVVEQDAGPTNLTLTIDVGTWFTDPDGSLIDPTTANDGGDNENLVESNIRTSIEVFEDEDEDGQDDG